MPAPEGYIDVATRIVEFRTKHPDGSLQAEIIPPPFDGFVVVKGYAYRSPDDPRPGTGLAWEPVPGPTSFTKDSELQNAETSAWGRAIVAALAADTKEGIASAQEVRNRQEETKPDPEHEDALDALKAAAAKAYDSGVIDQEKRNALVAFGRNSTEHARNALTKVNEAMAPKPAQPALDESEVPF